MSEKNLGDMGFIITKAPLESALTTQFLRLAKNMINSNKTIGVFLISDGVFLAKKNQKNKAYELITGILEKHAEVIASKDHLLAAGIEEKELIPWISISEKPYDDLVEFVMEKYRKVVVL